MRNNILSSHWNGKLLVLKTVQISKSGYILNISKKKTPNAIQMGTGTLEIFVYSEMPLKIKT